MQSFDLFKVMLHRTSIATALLVLFSACPGLGALPTSQDSDSPSTIPLATPSTFPRATPASSSGNRYGPLGLFDRRSLYGKGVFPEPSIVDDSDGEVNEFRLDWGHMGGKGQNANTMTMELEKGFGLLTFELEIPYDYDTSNTYNPVSRRVDHTRMQGFDNINPGARMPFFQYVSNNEFIDATFGVAIEVGIPSNSVVSKNAEIVPKIFNDTRFGEHFTIQTILGYSFLRGSPASGGGEQHFEYGFVFGYTIPHHQLPILGVQDFIPILELQGETLLNSHVAGSNNLVGNLAFRANMYSVGRVQPRLGVGFLFPVDQGAREDFHWGIYTSLVFEF